MYTFSIGNHFYSLLTDSQKERHQNTERPKTTDTNGEHNGKGKDHTKAKECVIKWN